MTNKKDQYVLQYEPQRKLSEFANKTNYKEFFIQIVAICNCCRLLIIA